MERAKRRARGSGSARVAAFWILGSASIVVITLQLFVWGGMRAHPRAMPPGDDAVDRNAMPASNAIVTLMTGVDTNAFRAFVDPLRDKIRYKGHIIIGALSSTPQETQDYLRSRSVIVHLLEAVPCDPGIVAAGAWMRTLQWCAKGFTRLTMDTARLEFYRRWVEDCPRCTGWVLVTDSRDVVIQSDPFESLPAPARAQQDLLLFGEYNINNSDWFTQAAMRRCYDLREVGFLNGWEREPMLCAGTTIGTRQGILRYLGTMVPEMLSNVYKWGKEGHCLKGPYGDQTVHNLLYYTGKFGPNATRLLFGHGPVLTVGTYCQQSNVLRLDAAGNIVNPVSGQRAAVVHQVDRCQDERPGTKAFLDARFFGLTSLPVVGLNQQLTSFQETKSKESLGALARQQADRPDTKAYPDARVVFSLTSFPGRLERVRDTIRSLATQSRPVDSIILSIPYAVKRIQVPALLPPIVAELQKEYAGLLHIHRTTDHGPITKLIGALEVEEEAQTIIITVDDDTVYHWDLALALIDGMERVPDHAVCFACQSCPWHLPTARPCAQSLSYQQNEGDCFGFQNAFAGTAYRRGFFGKGILNYSGAPEEACRLHDDVWISGVLLRKGIRPHVIRPGFWSIVRELGHTNMSIHLVEDTETKHRNPCLEYFDWLREPQEVPPRARGWGREATRDTI